jgi:pimeloyl-ACP methyl ester carboxylesterase
VVKIYFIAGLGANKRAFGFLDLSWCEPVFIDWIPALKNESLKDYALRLRQCIKEENPVIVGVSFGGMLVTEMAKADPGVKAIIISSNKTYKEFPAYLRVWKFLPVYKWVPPSTIKFTGLLTKNLIGPQGRLQKQIFKKIVEETDPVFTAWAIDAILHWNNTTVPPSLVHIHGTRDTLLPMRFVQPHHVVKGGKHIMIMDKAEEISALLKNLVLR